jgi:hypothetical protein
MEFPLIDLPAGSSVTRATLDVFHADGKTLAHSLRGYAGNGVIEEADVRVGGTAIGFDPSVPGNGTRVDVTSLVTPTVVASGWAGFLLRKEVSHLDDDFWHCTIADQLYPTLTIDYVAP